MDDVEQEMNAAGWIQNWLDKANAYNAYNELDEYVKRYGDTPIKADAAVEEAYEYWINQEKEAVQDDLKELGETLTGEMHHPDGSDRITEKRVRFLSMEEFKRLHSEGGYGLGETVYDDVLLAERDVQAIEQFRQMHNLVGSLNEATVTIEAEPREPEFKELKPIKLT